MSPDAFQFRREQRAAVIWHGIGITAAVFYLAWNILWVMHRQIPPSISLCVLGIPCPTTGVTRSLTALCHGDIWLSLCWNPLAVPITLLFATSVVLALRGLIWRKYRNLPKLVVWLWAVLWPLAWVIKLIQGPTWW